MEQSTGIQARLASAMGRRDEEPNIVLGREIAETNDAAAVKELAALLSDKNRNLQNDSIKVLYEAAALRPALVAPYREVFLDLLEGKNSRCIWGAMTALNEICLQDPQAMYEALPRIVKAAAGDSVVARDHAVKLMAKLYTRDPYAEDVWALLQEQLLTSPVNQLPMYAENVQAVIRPEHKQALAELLQLRMEDVEQAPKRKRIEKVIARLKGEVRSKTKAPE